MNPRAEALFLENILTARAYENTCAVIMVNVGAKSKSKSMADGGLNMKGERQGEEKEPPYAGMSRVCLPFVGALGGETKDTGSEAMSIVDVNMEHVEEAEKNYKVREDMARKGWHYEYRHTKENGAKL